MDDNSIDKKEGATETLDEPSTSSERPRRSSARRQEQPLAYTNSSNLFACAECDYVACSRAEKNFHMRQEHSGASTSNTPGKINPLQQPNHEQELIPERPISPSTEAEKPRRGRPRKILPSLEHTNEFIKPRVTTKELISGSRKKKAEPAVKTEELDPRIQALGLSGSDMSVGDYLLNAIRNTTQQNPYEQHENQPQQKSQEPITVTEGDLDDFMEIGREEEVDEVEEIDSVEEQRRKIIEKVNSYRIDLQNTGEEKKKFPGKRNWDTPQKPPGTPRKKGPPKPKVYDPKSIPLRLRVGDMNGKYACYMKDCEWKANYRSLRMEHMRVIHPDWVMPPRYLLQRISRDGVYIDPENYVPPIPCLVPGCPWRGNFRASRSSHMRTHHVEYYLTMKSKQTNGSYNPDGTYLCHLPECEWRGTSRSTRAQHMKREHPTWRTDAVRKSSVLLECFACNATAQTTVAMVQHVHEAHGIGLYVNQGFHTKADFMIWLNTVDRMFNCSFVRRMSPKQTPDYLKYYLVCGCDASKNHQFVTNARNAAYTTSFLKNRPDRIITRRRVDCCLYLDIREETRTGGRVLVSGCLEHTGHRWGSTLLRFNAMDRQLFHEFMAHRNINKEPMSMLRVLDVLNEIEGFAIDNMQPSDEIVILEPRDDDPIVSLYSLVCEDEIVKETSFGVDLMIEPPEQSTSQTETTLMINHEFSIGFMDENMKKYWSDFGPGRYVVIEKNDVELGNLTLTVFYVIVFDQVFLPKCCCVYLTVDTEKGYESVLRQLYEVDPRPPRTFSCDPSQIWVDLVEKIWPQQNVEVQISEWAILDFWAEQAEKTISSDFDKCYLICALRRLFRSTNMQQFMNFVVELFETLHETGLEIFARFFDYQLSDVAYFKRWSPFHRNPHAIANFPTVSVSVRYFRERFLDPFDIERIDQYFMHVARRTIEYNFCPCSDTYTVRPLEPLRVTMYDTVSVNGFGKMTSSNRMMRQQPQVYQEITVYPDEMVIDGGMEMDGMYCSEDIGPVVEEEILTMEGVGEDSEQKIVPMIMGMMDMDERTTIMHDDLIENKPPRASSVIEDTPSTSMEYQMYDNVEEHIEEESYTDEKDGGLGMDVEQDELMEPPPKMMKHETTKAVIGSRRPRNRVRLPNSVDWSVSSRVSVEDLASQIIDVDRRKGSRLPQDYLSYSMGMGVGLPERMHTRREKVMFDPNQPSTSTAVHHDPESDSGSNHIDW